MAGEAFGGDTYRPEISKVIRRVPMFASLSEEEALVLSQHAATVLVPTGETLFAEGEPARWLFVILSGEAIVSCLAPTGEAVVVGRLGPGSVLGEMAVLEGSLRSATATADTPLTALRLDGESFQALIESEHPAAGRVLTELRNVLVGRIRSLNERMDALFSVPTEDPSVAEDPSLSFASTLRGLWASLRGVR